MDRAVWRYSSSWKGWEFLGIAARDASSAAWSSPGLMDTSFVLSWMGQEVLRGEETPAPPALQRGVQA